MEWDVSGIVKKLRGELSEPGKKMTQAGFASFLNLRDPKPADEDDMKFVRPGDIQRLGHATCCHLISMNSTNVWNLVRVLRLTAISGEKVRVDKTPKNHSLHN